jgi:galactokinase
VEARASHIDKVFINVFGPTQGKIVVRSPGRVNLIGEHTDYNEGYVLPAAIDKAIVFAVAPRADNHLHFYAADLKDELVCDLNAIQKSLKGWPNYLLGVIDQLGKAGYTIRGCDVVFGGDIPIGAGLSSSAALECGFACALDELFGLGLDRLEIVKLAQRAENQFVGVKCGIMDQFVNIFGRDKKVLKIDCRSLEYEYFPFERDDLQIVLCETEVRRTLASSEYNVRRQQCEAGVHVLRRYNPGVRSLRDVSLDLLQEHKREMDPTIFKRCGYVVRENERVLEACDDLRQNDFRSFGQRMYESHRGLRDEYQVSSPELDVLVEIASSVSGVLGARMMGAGFGGCTINLVEEPVVSQFVEIVQQRYPERTGKAIKVYVTRIQSGTAKVIDERIPV